MRALRLLTLCRSRQTSSSSLEEVYHMPGGGIGDLLHDAVAHRAGLAQGRPAPLAPVFPRRSLHRVRPWQGPRAARMPSGSARKPHPRVIRAWTSGIPAPRGRRVRVLVECEPAFQLCYRPLSLFELSLESSYSRPEGFAVWAVCGHFLHTTR